MAPTSALENHPPLRSAAPLFLLFFGVAAGPIVWIIHLIVNAIVAGHACAGSELGYTEWGWSAERLILVAIDAAALVTAFAATLVSLWCWRAVNAEHAGTGNILQVGEGRTRFIAACGILTGAGFMLAILFDTFAAISAPRC